MRERGNNVYNSLKLSYYKQACANLRLAERQRNDGTLFDRMSEPEPEPLFGSI